MLLHGLLGVLMKPLPKLHGVFGGHDQRGLHFAGQPSARDLLAPLAEVDLSGFVDLTAYTLCGMLPRST